MNSQDCLNYSWNLQKDGIIILIIIIIAYPICYAKSEYFNIQIFTLGIAKKP